MTAASGKAEGGNVAEALAEAVAAIYFDDSSDYSSALWAVARILGGQAVADLLESDRRAAYEKYVEQQGSTPLTCYVNTPAANGPGEADGEVALNVRHKDCHKAAHAFWQYWRENGVPHKRGYYESTWGAINQALRYVGVVDHVYLKPRIEVHGSPSLNDCIEATPPDASESTPQPGMVTVPREPTKDMLEEGFDAINKQYARDPLDDALERTQAVYRAMLDAALRSGEKGTP